jgi:hypothetical protein
MTLLAIAEVLSGEALVSPGGPIDRDTAINDDAPMWGQAAAPQPEDQAPEQLELAAEPAPSKVLTAV